MPPTDTSLAWTVRAPGVWSAAVGPDETLRLLDLAGAPPYTEGLAALGETPFPLAVDSVRAEVLADRLVPRFPLYDDDGETYDYEAGELPWTELVVSRDEGVPEGGSRSLHVGSAGRHGDLRWRFMT
jgi:hypothetical protein